MINIIHKDGEFLVKGTFSFGIAGTNENKEYGTEQIELLYMSLEDIIDAIDEDDDFMYEGLLEPLKQTNKDADKIAEVLTNYYNEREAVIKKNEVQINNYFLIQLFSNIIDCAYPFWEIEQTILPEWKEKYTPEDYEKMLDEYADEITAMANEYYESPNDGSMEKTDVYKRLKEMFPMFDFQGLIATIKPEGVCFEGSNLCVQFSDDWGCDLYCAAYERFDEQLVPHEWHNH